tara:strand:+ start:427 stop:597 length:171 start_codon:yes stop_codon:yes gene_type:complete
MPVSLLSALAINFIKKPPLKRISIIEDIYKTRITAHLSLLTATKGASLLSLTPILA